MNWKTFVRALVLGRRRLPARPGERYADELISELEADPTYIRKREQANAERVHFYERLASEQAPLLELLHVNVEQVRFLHNLKKADVDKSRLKSFLEAISADYSVRTTDDALRLVARVGATQNEIPTLLRLAKEVAAGSDDETARDIKLSAIMQAVPRPRAEEHWRMVDEAATTPEFRGTTHFLPRRKATY